VVPRRPSAPFCRPPQSGPSSTAGRHHLIAVYFAAGGAAYSPLSTGRGRRPIAEHQTSDVRERVTIDLSDVDRLICPAARTIQVQPGSAGNDCSTNRRRPKRAGARCQVVVPALDHGDGRGQCSLVGSHPRRHFGAARHLSVGSIFWHAQEATSAASALRGGRCCRHPVGQRVIPAPAPSALRRAGSSSLPVAVDAE